MYKDDATWIHAQLDELRMNRRKFQPFIRIHDQVCRTEISILTSTLCLLHNRCDGVELVAAPLPCLWTKSRAGRISFVCEVPNSEVELRI